MEKKCKNCGNVMRDETKPCPFCGTGPLDEDVLERSVKINRRYVAVISWLTFLLGSFFFLVYFGREGLRSSYTLISIFFVLLGAFGIISRRFIFKREKDQK